MVNPRSPFPPKLGPFPNFDLTWKYLWLISKIIEWLLPPFLRGEHHPTTSAAFFCKTKPSSTNFCRRFLRAVHYPPTSAAFIERTSSNVFFRLRWCEKECQTHSQTTVGPAWAKQGMEQRGLGCNLLLLRSNHVSYGERKAREGTDLLMPQPSRVTHRKHP